MKPIADVIDGAATAAPPHDFYEQRNSGQARERVMLSTLDPRHHKDVNTMIVMAREWYKNRRQIPGLSMVILGPVGSGKSHVASACLDAIAYTNPDTNEWLGPVGRFFSADTLMQVATEENELRARLFESVPVVVIDDVGTEGAIEYVAADMQEGERQRRYELILNHLMRHHISLILTSNLDATQLRQHLGERAWSRLMQMVPRGYMLVMGDVPDYRLKKGGRT